MRGVRAKLLRKQAKLMSKGRPKRELTAVQLPKRSRWVMVPDDSKGVMAYIRNKFLHAIGIEVPMKRERQWYSPIVIREAPGTARWCYHRLKRMYYRLLSA
jgi:hypothetical protein